MSSTAHDLHVVFGAESALSAHRAGKVRVAIGRALDFFGPGVLDSVLGDRAIYPALQGKAAQLAGNTDTPIAYPTASLHK